MRRTGLSSVANVLLQTKKQKKSKPKASLGNLLELDTTESDKESSGDDNLCSSQLPKDVSPGQRLPTLCTYNLKASQVIFKAVFGKVHVDREDVVKVLKKKFTVKQHRLTSLTMTQLMELLAKKLVN